MTPIKVDHNLCTISSTKNTMLTVSEFLKKITEEKAAEEKRLQEKRAKEVKGAFQNIAMLMMNTSAWEDIKLLPRMIMIVLSDEAIDLFQESMKILGKEIICSGNGTGTIYKNTSSDRTINIDCNYHYPVENLDDIFAKIVDELADRGDSDRTEIEKIAEAFNNPDPWV